MDISWIETFKNRIKRNAEKTTGTEGSNKNSKPILSQTKNTSAERVISEQLNKKQRILLNKKCNSLFSLYE